MDNRELNISVFKNNSFLNIVVSNTILKSVIDDNPELQTTKSDSSKHGIGTKSVKRIVGAYNGMVDFYEEDSTFKVKVQLPC